MELFLNLLWLFIALASFARWRRLFRIRGGSRGPLAATFPLVALVCALSILFPAISVTDNLHPNLYVAEDGSSSRRAIAAAARASGALSKFPGCTPPPALLTGPPSLFKLDFVLEYLRIANFLPLPATLARILPSRAPPSL
jgi:hypothetical protein